MVDWRGHLLEREAELAQLEAAIDAASAGAGGVVLLEGSAGIGKSRLLRAAEEMAAAVGMRTLAARAGEMEADFPLGVVRQLFEPLLAAAGADERLAMFGGAAELAGPVFDTDVASHGTGDQGFQRLYGLYWLAVNLSHERPLMLVVDDLQWADAASERFALFLSRRLEGLPLMLIAAVRTGEPKAEALVARLTTESRPRVIRPAPLTPAAVGVLAGAALGQAVDDSFAGACHESTGGNPLLACELVGELVEEQLAPTAEHVQRLRALTPPVVSRSVLVRLGRLGAESVALARACAVLGDGAELRIAAALAGLGEPAAVAAADGLMRAAILMREPRLSFAHPILRAAVEADLGPAESAHAHAHAAELLAAEGDDPDRVALHLLHTRPAGDRVTVDRLRERARVAVARGASDAAVRYLRRALEEPPPDDLCPALHGDLGIIGLAAGEADAAEHLEIALESSAAADRPPIARVLAAAWLRSGRFADAVGVLDRALAGLPENDRETRLTLQAERVAALRLIPEQGPAFIETAVRTGQELAGQTPGERMILANLALALSLGAGGADETAEAARRALADGKLLAEHTAEGTVFAWALGALLAADRFDEFDSAVNELIADVRRRGSLMGHGIAHGLRGCGAAARGALRDAEADIMETLATAKATNWFSGMPLAVGWLVFIFGHAGRFDESDALLVEHGMTGPVPDIGLFHHLVMARGRLRFAQGHPREALDDFRELARRLEVQGVRSGASHLFWQPPAALALAALGDANGARRTAQDGLTVARKWGTPRAIGTATHALAVAEGSEEHMREAVATLDGSPARLEHAHALVDLGALLRRERRAVEAREPLRAALDIAQRLGAGHLVGAVTAELGATGEKRRRTMTLSGPEALTPSERRVAEMAAEGLTNKEIAQALFVTLKTVEIHLSRSYGKLGIGSRRELSSTLAAPSG